jgi:hypothetical protein
MDRPELGSCRLGFFRLGVFSDVGDTIISRFETVGSVDVTRKRLMLGTRDSTTGWYTKSFEETAIKMPIIEQGSTRSNLTAGYYVRTDALGLTVDVVAEGDEILSAAGKLFEVKAVREIYSVGGDSFSHRECDLTRLLFSGVTGRGYTVSTVEDARYRTKEYLETYLDGSVLSNYIVAYSAPDYPMTQVFKTKSIDLIFAIGKPDSKPLIGYDQTPYGYEEHVPIKIFAVDKSDVTGTKAVWQAETELRRITETYPSGSLRTLERMGDNDKNLGSTILYCTEYVLNYKRDTS